jgi:NADP-dependent 3-hydroxy acid dehydrogenase YdfG
MSEDLQNTTALVTGASSGIGAATAIRLAAEGATVALVARRRDRLDEVASTIEAAGGRSIVIEADVSDRAAAESAVNEAVDRMGRLDILVNNAGIMLLGPALQASVEEWDRMLSVNVSGVLAITHAGLPHLVRAAEDSPRGIADIVTISSTAGRAARPGSSVYNLTKFGVNAFSEALRQELVSQRVRVGVIEPGTVDTELVTHNAAPIREAAERQLSAIEALHPEDIADAVSYMVTRPQRAAVNELLIRAAEQTW